MRVFRTTRQAINRSNVRKSTFNQARKAYESIVESKKEN